MLEKYYLKPATIDRIHACWLGEPIERYVTWLAEQGYAVQSVHHRVPVLMRFAEFAASRGATVMEDLPDHVDAFVEVQIRPHKRRLKSKDSRQQLIREVRNPVDQLLRLILPDYSKRRRVSYPQPFAEKAPGFFAYLSDERGLRPVSIAQYAHHLRRLEHYLGRIELSDLGALSAAVLSAFFTESGQALGKHALNQLIGHVRIFVSYLYREKLIPSDLSRSIDRPRLYRLSTIPRAISWDDVRQLLAAVDRRSPVGKRDYAILLLLVTYGLRAREVAALTLDALDWAHERLAVPERKAGHSMAYPLSPVVGEAIIDYLQHGRVPSSERQVFLRACAPHTPLSWPAISQLTARRLRSAGIAVARPGSHTLRHTCVQRLVEAQFSLKAIGDYVGHRSPKSTEIYAKVDLESLREIALGDGEDLL